MTTTQATLFKPSAAILALSALLAFGAQPRAHEPRVPQDDSSSSDEAPGRPAEPLREVAGRAGLLVGTAMSPPTLRRDAPWAEILLREFSSLTPGNAMKWEFVHPGPDSWDFRQADAVVVIAEQNNMAIKGHAVIMRRSARWVDRLKGDAVAAALEDHVRTIVGRYKGRIRSWDVVNEAFEDDGTMRDSVFLRELGPQWIDQVFRWAHETDPAAMLLYNDFGIEQPGPKTDAVYELCRRLLDAGIPLHGLGMQSHFNCLEPPDTVAMAATMRRFANLGLSLNISELDVRVARYDGPQTERLQRQAQVYRDIVSLCGPGSGVDSITFWGFSDAHSWIGDRDGKDAPHLFDEDNRPKPAWFAVHEALSELASEVRRATPRVRQGARQGARQAERKPVRPARAAPKGQRPERKPRGEAVTKRSAPAAGSVQRRPVRRPVRSPVRPPG